jgi:hypothetical protein
MSVKNGVWHNAILDPPEDGVKVLCLRPTKGGYDYCLGVKYSFENQDATDKWDRWYTLGGDYDVIWWTPLPKIPEVKHE